MKREYEVDVLVAGGGPAGVAAAVGAAQAGAEVLLIERSPFLGGEGTHAGVGALCGIYTCGDNPQKCVAGVFDHIQEEMDRLSPKATEVIVSATGNTNVQFKPEYMKVALDNLMDRFQVKYLLHTVIIGAERRNGSLCYVRCADDEGEFTVAAKTFVDASGDANLSYMAGAATVWGSEDGQVMAATLPFRLSGVDTTKDMSPAAVERAVRAGKAAGIPNLTRERGFLLVMTGSDEVIALLPSVIPTGLSAWELTEMEKVTRGQALYYVDAFRRFMPGMENCELTMIGPAIGFRETRRMVGRQTLTAEDVLQRRKHPDGVGRGGFKPEIHLSLNEAATYLDVPSGSYYDIPLGCLRSADTDNLYGAGRLISADHQAMAASRVMGTCFASGHGAGVAAALQAKTGEVHVDAVRAELIRQGALI
ncbi:MAG: FAD-dependent oxidoreductase [Oscillospiraceae bacterium]|nr:FAD-dependent oxidoreductase [Oscillospiraceae bacterium]